MRYVSYLQVNNIQTKENNRCRNTFKHSTNNVVFPLAAPRYSLLLEN